MDNKNLIYGCMGIGGSWDDKPISADILKTAQVAIEAALEIGINHFDHADIYSIGKSEEVFGKILKAKPNLREKIILQSKAGIRFQELENSSTYELGKSYLLNQVDLILKRLNTEYLDIFMLHRPDPFLNPKELAETFNILKENGKVKNFGVSNMSPYQIRFIQNALTEPLIANQIELSIAHPLYIETGVLSNHSEKPSFNGVEGLLEYMQMHQMTIQAYSPLAQGRYSGNRSLTKHEDKKTIALINEMAEKYNTSPESILLAWVFKIPGKIEPIIGTTNPMRIQACKDALTIELTKKEWYHLWISARGKAIP